MVKLLNKKRVAARCLAPTRSALHEIRRFPGSDVNAPLEPIDWVGGMDLDATSRIEERRRSVALLYLVVDPGVGIV